MNEFFSMIGVSFTLLILLSIGLWALFFFNKNYSLLNIGWGAGFILVIWPYFFIGHGEFFKKLCLTLMATLWALNLIRYYFQRNAIKTYSSHDVWKNDISSLSYLIIFISQSAIIIVMSIPFLLVNLNASLPWTYWEAWAGILWFIGILGEWWMWSQRINYYKNPENKDILYQKGLSRFGKTFGYVFEMLIWIGFSLFAVPISWGWLAFIAPMIMLGLFIKFPRFTT